LYQQLVVRSELSYEGIRVLFAEGDQLDRRTFQWPLAESVMYDAALSKEADASFEEMLGNLTL
jgi:hypothetical protein